MNDKTAHAKLKKICEDTSRAKNSRRERNTRHEQFNETMNEIKKIEDRPVRAK